MHRRLLSAAATGALLLGLAACGEPTEGPVTTPPPDLGIDAPSDGGGETEPSDGGGETEEPTAEVPDIPAPDPADFAGMDEHTEDGAKAALKYYIAAAVWSHQTGDDTLLLSLEDGTCEGCKEFNSDIAEAKDHDLLWTESDITEADIIAYPSETFEYEVRYQFTLGAHSRADATLSKYIEVDDLEYDSAGGMQWSDKGWQIGALSIEWGDDVH